ELPGTGGLPLSFAQQRLWFIDQLEPDSSLYNMPVVLRMRGPLCVETLVRSFSAITRRHEALRTVFHRGGRGPLQVILPPSPFALPVVDLSTLPAARREARMLALVGEETGRPFDLSRGPLWRGALFRLGAEEHVAVVTLHHVVSDGWSMGILVREM